MLNFRDSKAIEMEKQKYTKGAFKLLLKLMKSTTYCAIYIDRHLEARDIS